MAIEPIDFYQLKVWELQTADGGCDGSKCGYMGCITCDVPLSHAAFGRAFVCICQREAYLTRRMAATIETDSVPLDGMALTLDDFDHLSYAQSAVDYARQMIEQGYIDYKPEVKDKSKVTPIMPTMVKRWGLMLHGGTGCGKTSLISVVYRHYVAAGKSVGWFNARGLIKKVQATYAKDYEGPDYEQIINEVARLDFLVLDDLGSPTLQQPYSEDHIEILLRILNYREANHLPLGSTSNCTNPQLLTQFGPRCHSRLHGLLGFVKMDGVDMRKAVGV